MSLILSSVAMSVEQNCYTCFGGKFTVTLVYFMREKDEREMIDKIRESNIRER